MLVKVREMLVKVREMLVILPTSLGPLPTSLGPSPTSLGPKLPTSLGPITSKVDGPAIMDDLSKSRRSWVKNCKPKGMKITGPKINSP